MIFDETLMFSDDQEVTGTAVSTNVIDLGADNRDIGKGVPVPLLIQVTSGFEGATSVTATVQTSNDEDFGDVDVLATSGAVVLDDLNAGYQFPIQYMPINTKRYLRINYTVAGTGTAGTITAGVVAAHQHGF